MVEIHDATFLRGVEIGRRLKAARLRSLAAPTLAPGDTWCAPLAEHDMAKSDIWGILIFDTYDPTEYDIAASWVADAEGRGDIMCYVTSGGVIHIAGNGMGKIMANPDSSDAFAGFSGVWLTSPGIKKYLDTKNVTNMCGMFRGGYFGQIERFDTRNVTNFSWMFAELPSTKELDISHFNMAKAADVSSMFYGCPKLTTVVLPASLPAIGAGMFGECTALTTVTMLATAPPAVGADAFLNCPLTQITVPAGCGAAYGAADGWSDYASIIVEKEET